MSGANLSRAKKQCGFTRVGRQAEPDRPQRQRCRYRVERGLADGDTNHGCLFDEAFSRPYPPVVANEVSNRLMARWADMAVSALMIEGN